MIYCISDIHGRKDRFDQFCTMLKPEDHVYVLGDVIDRGNDGMNILLDIMHNDQFTLLLGNHEHMMHQFLKSLRTYDHHLKNTYEMTWLYMNGGLATYEAYRMLDKKTQDEVYEYIDKLPLMIPNVQVNDKTYYLVHSKPIHTDSILTMHDTGDSIDAIKPILWDRVRYPFEDGFIKDKTVIAGHSSVLNYVLDSRPIGNCEDLKEASYINIDGGCASPYPASRLIVLCLDDLSYSLIK